MSVLKDLGEQGLLDLLPGWTKKKNPLVKKGIGDDAVVMADNTVLTSDAYAEGVHFSKEYYSAYDVGYKTAAGTLSDVAAMGAEPVCLLVNLFAPPETEVSYLQQLYQGLQALCENFSCQVAGGDTSRWERLILSLFALGKSKKPLLRSTAQPGDNLYLSGFPGLSEVGFRVLSRKISGYQESRHRHLHPRPCIKLGLDIRDLATACIDTSDGLSTDAPRLARASKVKLVIEQERLPIHPEILEFSKEYEANPYSIALNGGEDYQLLFTSKEELPSLIAGADVHYIGSVEQGEGTFLEIDNKLRPLQPRGWDHYR